MKKIITNLLLFLLLMYTVHSQSLCPVLCDSCPTGTSTCSSCYTDFQDTSPSIWTSTGTCPCPDGYYMDNTQKLCYFCPVTCQTCTNSTYCLTCIPGYQIDNNKQCTKRYSNPGQWLTMDVSYDLTQQKLSKNSYDGFLLIDYVPSISISNMIQNCSNLNSQLFFGMYQFDYNTQIIKSYFGLPHHDWIQIKFQFVAINRWTATNMILQINDQESYRLDNIEGVQYTESKQYSSSQRHRNFCFGSSTTGDPDNLGFINVYLSHKVSMLKIRVRTDLSNLTISPSGTDYPSLVYFGLSNFFVRVGTCPTNCKQCAGPIACIQCISPYVTTGTGTCQCDLSIAQLTETGRCVLKCQTGYLFTKIGTMTESKCILCSLLQDKLRNCLACKIQSNANLCLICLEGYILNSTGYCVDSCSSNTYIQVNYDTTYKVNKIQCLSCGTNCAACSFGVCTSCSNNTIYQQGNCVVTCSDGFYLNSNLNQCFKCPINCAKCTDINTCIQCTDIQNYTILSSSGLCVPKCIQFNNCTAVCHASCNQCFGTLQTQCASCSNISNFIQNYDCVLSCSSGYFSLDSSQCIQCMYPCSTCANYQSCLSCQPGYLLYQQKCNRQCPLHYYPDNSQVCQPCSVNCKTCFNQTACLTCSNNYILFEGTCVIETPCSQRVGFYFDEKTFQCLSCPNNCSSCYKDLCLRCNILNVLDNGKCIEQCSAQKIQISQTIFDTITRANATSRVCKWKDPLCNHYKLINDSYICDQCIFMNPMLVLTQTNQCSFTCPLGKIKTLTNNIVSCQSCPTNCMQCYSNLTCIRCATNYVLNPTRTPGSGAVQCLQACPQGYTSDGYQCIQCQIMCKVCDILGRCLQCYGTFSITSAGSCANYTCTILSQYQASNGSACVNCPTGCITCWSSTICSSCGLSSLGVQLYLKQSTCVATCGDGYFSTDLGYQCRVCPVQCLKCVSATQCSVCISSYYLLLHPIQRISGTTIGTCVKECPIGYYNSNPLLNTDKLIAYCAFCSSNCLSCYGPTEDQCLTCYGTFKLVNSRCVQNCPFNKYQDSLGHCDWCHPSCMYCTGPAQYQCISCSQGYYLYRSTCYPLSCPGSTYAVDYDSRVCQLCQWGCQVCKNPYNCSVCTGGFYLYDGWCYLTCPLNTQPYFDFVNQGYRCGNCSVKWPNCLQCINSTCQRCNFGYYLIENSATPCLSSCVSGYYAQVSPFMQCKKCPTYCVTCLSNDLCAQCSPGYFLSYGLCTNTCPQGKYYSRSNNTCRTCSDYCLNCLAAYQCQNCINNYYLYNSYQDDTVTNYCVKDCGDYRYEDSQTNTCKNCSMNCKTCNSFTNCTKCTSNYTLSNGYCYQNNVVNPTCNVAHCAKCLNQQVCQTCQIPYYLWIAVSSAGPVSFCADSCPNGTFAAGKTCHNCNTTCSSCKQGPNDCYQCASGMYLYQKRCWRQCPDGFYQNGLNNSCSICPLQCFDCVNLTYCKTCQSNKKIYKGYCYQKCPQGTYEQGSTCFDCLNTCQNCLSSNYCTECKSTYVLFQNQCKVQCPSTHYLSLNQDKLTCKHCRYPCKSCKSQSQCTTCSDDYYFDAQINACVNDCGQGRYSKNNSIEGFVCSPCTDGCKKCLNSTYCLQCDQKYSLLKGKCVDSCPIGTYSDNSTSNCKSCSSNCLVCKAFEACIQCHNQTVLLNGKCAQFCLPGTYQVSSYSYQLRTSTNLCKPCQSPCKQCNGSSIYNCKSCVTNYYLYESVCVTACPIGFYGTGVQIFTSPSVAMNLVRNGDLSVSKCVNDWCSYNNAPYNGQVDGWIPDDQLQIGYGRIYNSYLGTQRVFQLAPNKNSCVKQLIPNLVAADYLLQFTWAARNGRTFSDCQFKVYFNGQQIKYVMPSDFLAHSEAINVTLSSNSSSTQLKFCGYGGDNNSYGALLKDIILLKTTAQMTTFSTTLVNSVQMKCVKCQSGCITCNSKTSCTSCITGWTLNNNNQCYPNTNCTLTNCQICQLTASSTKVCWKCINPYSLIKNTLLPVNSVIITGTTYSCILTCPINTFKTDNYSCLSCPTNCSACSYTECSACKAGFFLFKTSCVTSCPTGYTSDSTLGVCTPTPCLYKNSNGTCQQCISPYLMQRGICVTSCAEKTYLSDNYCMDCDAKQNHCYNCNSLTSCTSCIDGYFLYLGVCISKCPISYYQTTIGLSKTCISCQNILLGCLSCANSTTCIQCKFPYFLNSGQCSLTCPTNYYKSSYNQICLPCSVAIGLSCISCSNETTCITCNSSTVLFNGRCLNQCPNGYYLAASNICQPCNSKCFSCNSISNCTICQQGYFLMPINSGGIITQSCIQACQLGYYEASNSTCSLCSSECLTCDFEKCLSCQTPKFLYNGKCVTLCPDNYFGLNTKCIVCNSQCKTCSDNPSNCLTCYTGYIYQVSSKACLKNCSLATQYYDSLTYTCLNCSMDCQTCYGARYDQCVTCKDPYSLLNGICSLKCPIGFYRDSNSVCRTCDSTKCLTCSGIESNCTSCLYPKVLVIYGNGLNGKCDINCGSGYYYDRVGFTCKQCSTGCVSCSDSASCTACENTKYLYQDKCISTCPSGFIGIGSSSNNVCQKCPTNCIQCSYDQNNGQINCLQCVSPLYLYNFTCYTTCPTLTYLSNIACLSCPQTCTACTDAVTCISCKYPYVFYNNQCLTTCPSGYQSINSVCKQIKTCSQMLYKNICYPQCPIGSFAVTGSNQCLDCPSTCSECLDANICTSCKAGFYMYVNEVQAITCVQSCPLKTYTNNKYCISCPPPCLTCSNNNDVISCVTCITGYSLDGNCLAICPNGYYQINGICTKCSSKCLTCDSNGCTICANAMYTAPICESSTITCTTGQYVSPNSTCANCDASCLTCFGSSAGQCKACNNVSSTVYYLYGSSCITDCPQGYLKDVNLNKCTTCLISNCKNCANGATTCSLCNTGYILFTNSTVTKCILSCTQLSTALQTYIYLSTNCISCDSQIINCYNCYYSATAANTLCTICSTGYYLLSNGTCTNVCTNGLYISQSKYCLPCGSYCSVCTSDSVCQTCINNYVLYQSKCYSTCPIGYYNNLGVCSQCEANCKSCTSSQCTTCTTPFALDNSNHCTVCISGYFYSSLTSSCQICSSNCLQCLTTQSTCTKCSEPLYLLDSKCFNACPNGFYGNVIPAIDICSTCQSLVTNCATCLSGGCLKCKDTFYLQPVSGTNIYSCVSSCLTGYYPNTANMICLKCNLANCLQCSSLMQCTKCATNYYALQGTCYSSCPQGYAPSSSGSLLQCVSCKTGCKTCPVSVNTCTLCDTNLQVDANGNCVSIPNNCLSTQYLNSLGTCSSCHQTCLTCFGGLRINCLTCYSPGYQLQTDNSCKQMCPTTQYYDTITSSCKPCIDKFGQYCTYCDSLKCSSCSLGSLATDGQSCISTCTGATYQYNGACVNCPQYCKTCTSSTQCTECLNLSYLLYNNLCYSSCPLMTQSYNGTCRACDDKCLVCVDTTTNCTSCKSIYLLYGNNCVDSCPIGTYEGSQVGINNIICLACLSPCLTCSISATNCTSCSSSLHLYNNICINDCPSGTFLNYAQNKCYACQYPCSTCVSTATNCTSCQSGYVYNTGNICNSQCSDGTYLSSATNVTSCVNCAIAHCKSCDNNQCYKCFNNFYGTLSASNIIVSCTPTCPDYYYADSSTGLCVKCIDLCMTCTSSNNCQKCVTPYFLYNNNCLNSCPQQTYSITNVTGGFKCQDCGALCQFCTDNITCNICFNGAYLLLGTCYQTCPIGYYERDFDKSCQQCELNNCGDCTVTQCIQCKDNYFGMVDINNKITSCLSQCGNYFFQNSNTHLCEKCFNGCKICDNSITCQQCQSPKSLFINNTSYSCLDQCPQLYFSDNSTTPLRCKLCEQNCLQCYSTTECYHCIENYFLFYNTSTQQTCITSCPTYYYQTVTAQGYAYCQSCSPHCIQCVNSHQCTTCQDTHTLMNYICVPHNCVNCDVCDQTVQPAICVNCTSPYSLYKIKCFDQCPVYYFSNINVTNQVKYCQKCLENCINCTTNDTCDQCIPDYIFVKGQGCVSQAVYNYGPAANMSGFTSNITQTMTKIYMGTSVGPVAFGQMSTTYFNLQFTQFMQFHPAGGNPEMTEFLNSLQTMSLTNGGTTVSNSTAPQQVQARRRMLATSTYFSESFIEVNASIFYIMFAFLGAYITIWVFQKFVTQACRVSCNKAWFYLDAICEFMQKRFKWIYFDFIMWLSYVPFVYFAVMQLKQFSFNNGSQGFSSILAIIIIGTYPLYPFFICYLLKSHYSQISIQPGQQIKQTLTEMSLSPYLTNVKRPVKNIVLPWEQQEASFRKYFNTANFILMYYPLKYVRKFAFVVVAAIVTEPVNTVSILIAINVLFIIYMIALRPRTMPYMIFDLIIQFVLLAFEAFLLIYLMMDGSKVAMMSIVTHAVGFITANLSLITAIVLNLVAYYKIFLCIKDLISHLKQRAAQRQQAYNKFEVQKQFLDPDSDLYIQKEIGKLKKLNDNDDTDQDDSDLRLSGNGRKLLQNLGQKDLLLNGIDPIKYVKDLTKKQHFGIEQKQIALKYVNEDDVTDSDDSQIDENTMDLAKKLGMNEKTLALNKIHPVKYAKQLTKDDAPLQKQYKKFDEKHIDSRLAKKINDNGQTDSDDDSIDENVMSIAKALNLNQKQLALNDINPIKFLKEQTKKDAPLQDAYKKFDEKNVDKKLARVINEDNGTDSDDSDIDQQVHDLAKKLQLNQKQLAFNQINPVKFFKQQTKKDAPLQQQYQKFDEKNVDKKLVHKINEQNNTDSQDDSSVDQDAHNLARKLNLNEKQLAFNEINPLKFFKQQTKKDAPLQQQYQKFDQKNVDRNLVRIINDDGQTDSENQDDQGQNQGYRIARQLKLNEKQLAANNLNPVKVMQQQAKQDQKLQNIKRQFDQKQIDMKVARMINDNGQTSSDQDQQDEQEIDKIIVARQLKLDQKQLAANNINPVKYAKQATKIDPVTNQPKINHAILSTAIQNNINITQKPRKKLLDKQLQLRNQMKRQLSQNQGTDQDQQQDNKLSKFTKQKLKNMTEKQMMMQGLDPIKAVKKITKQAIAKKMAKKINNRVYDDQIPDFKVSSNKPANPIKQAIRSTQQKLKQSTKNMLGSKKQNLKGSKKIPSQQNINHKQNSNLIDSQSDQDNTILNKGQKMLKSMQPQNNRVKNIGPTRKQVQRQWDDQFQVIDKKKSPKKGKQSKKQVQQVKKQKLALVDPNNKIKNFDQQFSDSFIHSQQSSQAALHLIKHTYEQDIENIQLQQLKSNKLTPQIKSNKIINLDANPTQVQTIQRGQNKKSHSQLNMKPQKHVRQDQIFNDFQEFQDLGQVKNKQINDKKYQRKHIQPITNGGTSRQNIPTKSRNNQKNPKQFQDQQISSVEQKQAITEPKFKRNIKQQSKNASIFQNQLKDVTQSITFKDNDKPSSRNKIKSDKAIEAQRYSELVKNNKANIKLPSSFENQPFQQIQYQARPSQRISRNKSKVNSDNQSDDGYSNNIRKQRIQGKQKVRSRHAAQQNSQSNGAVSGQSSQVVRRGDKQTKLRLQKIKIQNMSENQDEIQRVDI